MTVGSGDTPEAAFTAATAPQEGGRCFVCQGRISGYTDPYDGKTPRWRHVGESGEYLGSTHAGEPVGTLGSEA